MVGRMIRAHNNNNAKYLFGLAIENKERIFCWYIPYKIYFIRKCDLNHIAFDPECKILIKQKINKMLLVILFVGIVY